MSKNAKADAFVVTTEDGSYSIVEADVLERYAIKSETDETGSKQLKTDGWEYDDTLLEPLYDPLQLCELLEINTYHENCVDVVCAASVILFVITSILGALVFYVQRDKDAIEKKKKQKQAAKEWKRKQKGGGFSI